MNAPENRAGRALARLAAAVAAALGAGALALPASARAPAEDGAAQPYLHAPVDLGEVEPGEPAGANPVILQAEAMGADAAAVVVQFHHQHELIADNAGIAITAAYDNCADRPAHGGVACVIADFEDAPGQAFTFTGAVDYALAEDAPGPFAYCDCSYQVFTLTEERAEADYGEGVLEAEGDLLGLVATDPGDREFAPGAGSVSLAGAANGYDLAVAPVSAAGDEGDRVTVDIPVANDGPADASGFFDGPGSYALLGELPQGTALVEAENGRRWNCFTGTNMVARLDDEVAEGRLAELDFACLFLSLEPGESQVLEVTVKITDEDAEGAGSVEVVAFDPEGCPGDSERDAADDAAAFTLDRPDSARLPATGTPLAVRCTAAGAALAAGALLSGLSRRRAAE